MEKIEKLYVDYKPVGNGLIPQSEREQIVAILEIDETSNLDELRQQVIDYFDKNWQEAADFWLMVDILSATATVIDDLKSKRCPVKC